VAVPVWLVALCIYGLMTWLILWRSVAQRQNPAREGGAFEPDTWILMGGMAIATLAGDNIHSLAPPWLTGPVLVVTVVTWVVATLWIPPLIYFSLHRISHRPEMLHFAGVWWASCSRWVCTPRPVTPWQPRSDSGRWSPCRWSFSGTRWRRG
jgi:hypothetical protein